jgi:hypothetical protein
MTFTKLHATILDSSIWQEPSHVRIVWITMLAMADQDGVVHASIGGLAHRANVTREQTLEALTCFMSPDPDSRDRTSGERVEEVPGGWLILNHSNYRDRQTREQMLTAARVAKHRSRPSVTEGDVTPYNATSPSEAEAEADNRKRARLVTKPESVSDQVWEDFNQLRRAKRAPITKTVLASLQKEAEKAGWTIEQVLAECLNRNWQGFKAEWVATNNVGRAGRNGFPPRPASSQHIPNMPLGHTGCSCPGCVSYRLKSSQGTRG